MKRKRRRYRCCAWCGVPVYGLTCKRHVILERLLREYHEGRVR
jgi:hypothetical protein